MSLTFKHVMTALLQWYQLMHLDCSIKVHRHIINYVYYTNYGYM